MFEDSLFTPMEEERENNSPTGSQFFISFLNQLEGWKTKCKNLHWASTKKNIHVYLDDFLSILQDYQDGLAEEEMGIYGKMLPNVIKGTQSPAITPKEFILEVKRLTYSFYENIPQDTTHAGIRSECESFIHNIHKYIYLFSLSDWEFNKD